MLLIFSILSCGLLSSCAAKTEPKVIVKTEEVFFIPKKVATPVKPTFQEYDKTKFLYQAPNFNRLQQNTVLLKSYCNSLKETVTYYETAIDELNKKRMEMSSTDKQ